MLTVDLGRAGIAPGRQVLDLGCGAGRHTFAALREGADVVALDRDLGPLRETADMVVAMRAEGEIEHARSGAIAADVASLPFPDRAFDVVVASEVLEHIVEDATAIGEIARVLRPGGTLALSVPRAGPERVNWALSREYHSVEGGHVRIYRRRALVRHLAAHGLTLVASHHRHGLHSPYWWLRCTVGVGREDHRLVAAYHRFLVWDIVRRPLVTRALERVLDPLIGKSLVLYCARTVP